MYPSQLIGSVKTPYGQALVYVGRYPVGGAIAMQLVGRTGEPVGILSTNIVPSNACLADNEFFVKVWSENAPLVEPMLKSGLFEDTGRTEATGFVAAPVWRIKDPANVPAVTRRLKR